MAGLIDGALTGVVAFDVGARTNFGLLERLRVVVVRGRCLSREDLGQQPRAGF